MNWICDDCKKQYSIFTERINYSCRECVVNRCKIKEEEDYKNRIYKVKKLISIFKADNEKFYKTIAVLAMLNGIEFDDDNNDAIYIRGNDLR